MGRPASCLSAFRMNPWRQVNRKIERNRPRVGSYCDEDGQLLLKCGTLAQLHSAFRQLLRSRFSWVSGNRRRLGL